VQRTSADLKCNPHIHAVFLDGVFVAGPGGGDAKPVFHTLACISHTAVADLLQIIRRGGYRTHPREMTAEIRDNGSSTGHTFSRLKREMTSLSSLRSQMGSTRRPMDLAWPERWRIRDSMGGISDPRTPSMSRCRTFAHARTAQRRGRDRLIRVPRSLFRPQGAVYSKRASRRSPSSSPSRRRHPVPWAEGVQGGAREPLPAGASRSGSSWRCPRI